MPSIPASGIVSVASPRANTRGLPRSGSTQTQPNRATLRRRHRRPRARELRPSGSESPRPAAARDVFGQIGRVEQLVTIPGDEYAPRSAAARSNDLQFDPASSRVTITEAHIVHRHPKPDRSLSALRPRRLASRHRPSAHRGGRLASTQGRCERRAPALPRSSHRRLRTRRRLDRCDRRLGALSAR
jgi:hypothetical protein